MNSMGIGKLLVIVLIFILFISLSGCLPEMRYTPLEIRAPKTVFINSETITNT